MLRPIRWLGSSLDDIRAMPEETRRDIGAEPTLVQGGPPHERWTRKSILSGSRGRLERFGADVAE